MLARSLEAAGLSTTSISLVREHTEKVKPPRALWVPFPFGLAFGLCGREEAAQIRPGGPGVGGFLNRFVASLGWQVGATAQGEALVEGMRAEQATTAQTCTT